MSTAWTNAPQPRPSCAPPTQWAPPPDFCDLRYCNRGAIVVSAAQLLIDGDSMSDTVRLEALERIVVAMLSAQGSNFPAVRSRALALGISPDISPVDERIAFLCEQAERVARHSIPPSANAR